MSYNMTLQYCYKEKLFGHFFAMFPNKSIYIVISYFTSVRLAIPENLAEHDFYFI